MKTARIYFKNGTCINIKYDKMTSGEKIIVFNKKITDYHYERVAMFYDEGIAGYVIVD